MTKHNDRFDRARLQDEFPAVPEGFHRRMAQTLDGLEEKPVKKKLHLSAMLIAAVILTLATGAVAATYRTGWVDIDGNFTPDEHVIPESTHYEPEIEEDTPMQMESVPGEYHEIVEEDGSYGVSQGFAAKDIDELANMLDGTDLPVPVIPEGLMAGGISVNTDRELEPYETLELVSGKTMRKYRLKEPTAESIKAYSLSICESLDEMARMYMDASIECDVPDMRFSATEQDLIQVLEVPGYDKALYIRWDAPDSFYAELGPQNQLFLARAVCDHYVSISVYGQGEYITSDTLLSLVPPVE